MTVFFKKKKEIKNFYVETLKLGNIFVYKENNLLLVYLHGVRGKNKLRTFY